MGFKFLIDPMSAFRRTAHVFGHQIDTGDPSSQPRQRDGIRAGVTLEVVDDRLSGDIAQPLALGDVEGGIVALEVVAKGVVMFLRQGGPGALVSLYVVLHGNLLRKLANGE